MMERVLLELIQKLAQKKKMGKTSWSFSERRIRKTQQMKKWILKLKKVKMEMADLIIGFNSQRKNKMLLKLKNLLSRRLRN